MSRYIGVDDILRKRSELKEETLEFIGDKVYKINKELEEINKLIGIYCESEDVYGKLDKLKFDKEAIQVAFILKGYDE